MFLAVFLHFLPACQDEDFLARVSVMFEVSKVQEGGRAEPESIREVGMCLRGDWYRLKAKDRTFPAEDPVKSLDVQVRELVLHCTAPFISIPRYCPYLCVLFVFLDKRVGWCQYISRVWRAKHSQGCVTIFRISVFS